MKPFEAWMFTLFGLLLLFAVCFTLKCFIDEPLVSLVGFIALSLFLSVLIGFPLVMSTVERIERRKKAASWEFEDQLKELEEQLGRGTITQEEYEEKKKKLLEKHQAR